MNIWGYPVVMKLGNGVEIEVPLLYVDGAIGTVESRRAGRRRVEVDMNKLGEALALKAKWQHEDDRIRGIVHEELKARGVVGDHPGDGCCKGDPCQYCGASDESSLKEEPPGAPGGSIHATR